MVFFYPNLVELIGLCNFDGFNCVWHTRDKTSRKWRTCRNPILAKERGKRNGLIRDLQALLSDNDSKMASTPNATRYEDNCVILSILHSLSKLVLCTKSHRSSYSTVLQWKWTESLEHLERDEINTIRRKLGMSLGERLTCHGYNQGIACENWIEATKRELARVMLKGLTSTTAMTVPTRSATKELAFLLLCSTHLAQVDSKSKEWSDAFGICSGTVRQESPQLSEIEVCISQSSQTASRNSPIRTRTTRSVGVAPIYSPKIFQATDQPHHDRPRRSHARDTRRAIFEQTRGFLAPELALTSFEPLKAMTDKALSKKVITLINRDLLPSERDPGYIYAFQRDSCDKIKIGFSKNVKNRMKTLSSRCKQHPKVLIQEHMPHAMKAEKLIQLLLYRERRTETLVNKLCNGSQGCSTVHREWFEVAVQRAEAVIKLVQSFAECMPYTKDGHLKEVWKLHFKDVEMMSLVENRLIELTC